MEQCTHQNSVKVLPKLGRKDMGNDLITCAMCKQLYHENDITFREQDEICKDCEGEILVSPVISPISAIRAVEYMKEWMGLTKISIQEKNDKYIIMDAVEYDEKTQRFKYRVEVLPDRLGSYEIHRMKVNSVEDGWEWIESIPPLDSISVIAN